MCWPRVGGKIRCFPYVELSDVPRLQQVHKSRRTAEESRTNSTNEDLLNIKRKGDPEVLYPLSYVQYHYIVTRNPCVIKVILLACFTYIDIF
jgi:hypothetical protein